MRPKPQTRILNIIKLLWVLIVLITLALFINKIPSLINFKETRWGLLCMAIIGVVLAHFSVCGLREITTRTQTPPLSYKQNALIFSSSNLSKYIPFPAANIAVMGWLLKEKGLSNVDAGRSILLGVYWTISSSLLIGILCLFWILPSPWNYLIILCIPFWLALNFIRPEKFLRYTLPYNVLYLTMLQIGVWVGYGSAFAITLLALTESTEFIRSALAYILSFGVGLLAVFAPAGAGIREGVAAYTLNDLMNFETIIAVTILMRVVIFFGDLMFTIIILFVSMFDKNTSIKQ